MTERGRVYPDPKDEEQSEGVAPDLRATDFVVGERLSWAGHDYEVIDVAPLTPDHEQVVLRPLSRKGLPVSVPARELSDAVRNWGSKPAPNG